jgi:hypothetical protein
MAPEMGHRLSDRKAIHHLDLVAFVQRDLIPFAAALSPASFDEDSDDLKYGEGK